MPRTEVQQMPPDERALIPSPEDDHDVLTFREAGERLAEEIDREQERCATLAEAGDAQASDASRRRVEQLRAAAERQRTGRRAAQDNSAFFGTDDP